MKDSTFAKVILAVGVMAVVKHHHKSKGNQVPPAVVSASSDSTQVTATSSVMLPVVPTASGPVSKQPWWKKVLIGLSVTVLLIGVLLGMFFGLKAAVLHRAESFILDEPVQGRVVDMVVNRTSGGHPYAPRPIYMPTVTLDTDDDGRGDFELIVDTSMFEAIQVRDYFIHDGNGNSTVTRNGITVGQWGQS